jgi:two-component system CheB/CheR fusion protein
VVKKASKTKNSEGALPHDISTPQERKSLFPVVAIGASSGGLQALSELLENLPNDLGMAYVVIQHLSPTHESILPEILSKRTTMKVHQVTNGIKLEKDNVYVIPANTFMSVVENMLTLSERVRSTSGYHAIDFFLNALAPVYQAKAVAAILSGSGTDGTNGIQSIKAHGGITFAQDESAAFSGMPKTAADSGFTDFVLSPMRIAEELASIAKDPRGIFSMNELAEANETALRKLHALMHNKKGVDFSYYKQTTIHRRIMRRVALNKFNDLNDYITFLRENAQEVDLLYKDLLINVTSFFRDPNVYEALSKKIFPEIFKDRKENDTVRIWTPACANGEEAYSLAICIFEFLREKSLTIPIQIFGTDLNETAIDRARAGVYHRSVLTNASSQDLQRYFIKTDGRYQIIKPIRDICIFAVHNLLKDPPFSRMDLISCQNVLIYLETNPQKKILQAFHYSLKPSGYLLLGRSETIGNSTELFQQLDKELKIYSKKDIPPGNIIFDFSLRSSYSVLPAKERFNAEALQEVDIEKETDRLLLSRYVPASVLVNKDLQVLRFHGATSNYLQPATGRASLNLLKMVKDELVFELKGLINRARKETMSVKKEGVRLSQNGTEREIGIEVAPVKLHLKDHYYLILFRENDVQHVVTEKEPGNKTRNTKDERIPKLEQQLIEAREYMKTMSEEFELTREELQSAHEEVLSSNEELQSINEELETSKEELQSTNEELITINEELQQRNSDLKELSDFSEAIVETINEPILVLTSDMRIRMANKAFYTLFQTDIDRTEGHYFFEMEGGQWNIPELKRKLGAVAQKDKDFENFEISKVFPGVGQKDLLFNAMRMEQPDVKKNKILIVIEDITLKKRLVKSNWKVSG